MSWQQKFSVGFSAHGIQYYWGGIRTRKTQLNVEIRWPAGRCSEQEVAEALDLPLDRVEVENYDDRFDTITAKISPGYYIAGAGFTELIREAHELFPSSAVIVLHVDVGLPLQQQRANLGAAFFGGLVRRRPAIRVPRVDVGAVVQQQGTGLGVLFPVRLSDGGVQRRLAVRVPRVDVGPVLQQQSAGLGVTFPRGPKQRGPLIIFS